MTQPHMGSQRFRCIICDKFINRTDVLWAHKAERIDDSTCVCENCLPEWKNTINPPDLGHLHDQEKKESFISHFLRHSHTHAAKEEEETDTFHSFIKSASDDPPLRAILLSIAKLPGMERDSLVDLIVNQLTDDNAPDDLVSFLKGLKDKDTAAAVVQMLE